MQRIELRPAGPGTEADVEHTFTGGGDAAGCQCQWWTIPLREFRTTTRDEKTRMLHDEMAASPPPGLIALVDGEPAGWVRVGPRIRQPRLLATRAWAASPDPKDAADVWAISCFSIRREHRGSGLMRTLIDGAVALAREHGARVVEAYPYDLEMKRVPVNDLYVGVLGPFLEAGFTEVGRRVPHRPVVSLTLTEAGGDTVSG
ncbi:GNAT family N-acetyltransferase [Microbacterium sp. GXF7504]